MDMQENVKVMMDKVAVLKKGQSQKFMKNLMNDRFQGSMNDAISFMWY